MQRSQLTEYRYTPPTSTMSFSLLPATLKPRKAVYDDQSFLSSARFGHHAAARCPAFPAQPQDDDQWPADSNHHALAVRLLLWRRDRRWPGQRFLHQLRRARDHYHDRGQWMRNDGGEPRNGHER